MFTPLLMCLFECKIIIPVLDIRLLYAESIIITVRECLTTFNDSLASIAAY